MALQPYADQLPQAGAMTNQVTKTEQLTNRIRLLRFMQGEMTQAELGEKIGVTRQTIAAIEAGKYSPTLEAAFKIARVFDVPLEEVFQWQQPD